MKYEEALRKLEDIVARMEAGDVDVDQLAEQLKQAQQLLALCRDKLTKAGEEIKKILEKTE